MLRLIHDKGGVVMVTFALPYTSDAYRRWSADSAAEKTRLNAPPYAGLFIGQPEQAATAYADWLREHPRPVVTLAQVADQIDYVARVAGHDHVGLGGDFDGVGNALPDGLGDVASYPALLAELMRRGWSDSDIARLAGGNILAVMTQAERVAAMLRDEPPATVPLARADRAR